ncbi:MAG: nickel-dependent hydrogenase large subunit [Rubrivivax sp.]|nr:nickel-dependent hydrogenase large subunit [Rubrivivax sp.]
MPQAPTGRRVLGPFNRVEGDLEVQLTLQSGRVARAEVCAPMYRGFENLLQGRPPMDALVIVPRICGICSVSQSVAAARALADLAGQTPPPNGAHAINLMLACENLSDHLTHFYLFFMPDFTRPFYAARPWHAQALRRFAAQQGVHARHALAARQRWMTMLGTLGGKWPHTQSIQPGGSARAVEAAERLRLLAKAREFRAFLEEQLFADELESVAALASVEQLDAWHAQAPMQGDLRFFLTLADDLDLWRLGPGPGRYLSYGAYRQSDGSHLLAPGVWSADEAAARPVAWERISEDATHAWLEGDGEDARHPWHGHTRPQADKAGAYTWNKAPRLAGRVVETGALARQLVQGHPLLRELVGQRGSGVAERVLARALELAQVLPEVERWLAALQPGEPFHTPQPLPAQGRAFGVTEAARGALGHWLCVADERIANYQIVSPTSWNFSPRDADGVPGALEAALQDLALEPADEGAVAVQHVVRSFDPCMVCTVH